MLSGGTPSACAITGTPVLSTVVSSDSMKKPTATNQGSSFLAVAEGGLLSLGGEGGIDHGLRLRDEPVQMLAVVEAFRIDLVDVLRARGARREPAALGDHLE